MTEKEKQIAITHHLLYAAEELEAIIKLDRRFNSTLLKHALNFRVMAKEIHAKTNEAQ